MWASQFPINWQLIYEPAREVLPTWDTNNMALQAQQATVGQQQQDPLIQDVHSGISHLKWSLLNHNQAAKTATLE